MNRKQKIIAIVGPTATGKSALGVYLAKKFGGEIISADSRQVYRGLDIGSGKITKREMQGVPHHMLDVASPLRIYSVSRYQKEAEKVLASILARGKTPIVVGGTGLFVDALLLGKGFPDVPPNMALRKKLEKIAEELFLILKKLDPRRAKTIEKENPRRVIRAIEIARTLGSVPHLEVKLPSSSTVLWIGLTLPEKELRKKIRIRLFARIKKGMIMEVKKLRKNGLSWRRLEGFGLEYRYIALFLQKKLSKEEMVQKLETEIWRYTRRQLRWFKRNKNINWFNPSEKHEIEKTVQKFIL